MPLPGDRDYQDDGSGPVADGYGYEDNETVQRADEPRGIFDSLFGSSKEAAAALHRRSWRSLQFVKDRASIGSERLRQSSMAELEPAHR